MTINSNVTINTVSILVNIKLSLGNKKAIPKYSLVLDHYQGEAYNLGGIDSSNCKCYSSPLTCLGIQPSNRQYKFKS